MYTVKVESTFSGAHNLRGYRGKCEELHGHNWKVEVEAASATLDGMGMVADFQILKDHLARVLSPMDHKYLNEIAYFKDTNPTSENIARYIFDQIHASDPNIPLTRVTVSETQSSAASYVPL